MEEPKIKNSQILIGKGIKYTVIGASVVNIFLQLANFVMLFYSVVITGNETLTSIFPNLLNFTLVGVIIYAIALFVVGYFWRNKSQFFDADRRVDVATDPYQTSRYVPCMVPIWKVLVQMAKTQNINSPEVLQIEEFIKNSENHK